MHCTVHINHSWTQESTLQTLHERKIEKLRRELEEASLEGMLTGELCADLGQAYDKQYKATHEESALANTIKYYTMSLEHYLDEGYYGPLLNNLGIALQNRYKQQGDMKDLEQTIVCHQQALDLRPPGHPDHGNSLNNLASALQYRYKKLGNMADLEQAIISHRQALDLHPPGHPLHGSSLNNLGSALKWRYEQLGDMKDLEQTIVYHRQALDLRPLGHPDCANSLNNLAGVLQRRYEQLGDMKDLEQTIVCYQGALDLYPPGHPLHSTSLNNLGSALNHRYKQLGDTKDLEQTIICHRQALDLCPPGHTSHSRSLNNLGNALMAKYRHLGDLKDLEQAILYHEQALDLRPPGHPDHGNSVNNLARALQRRYEKLGDVEDLERAIIYYRQALDQHPPGHHSYANSLHNLADALHTRYVQVGDMQDLEQTIVYHQQTLSLHPPGHPLCPTSLNGLGSAFRSRFLQLGNLPDMISATESFKDAVSLLPPHHPLHCTFLYAQASFKLIIHNLTWVKCKNCSHVHDACTLFESAANHLPSGLLQRFKASKKWVQAAHKHNHKSVLTAYSKALELQQQHLALLPSISSQHKFVETAPTLALNAASCAVTAGNLEAAVVFLEQGRSILWSKMQGYISRQDPGLAEAFTTVAHQLEHNAVSDDVDIGLQRTLSEKWTQLLQKIRTLDGFADFLQAVPFGTLKSAADEGPIIMVNISDYQCNAIILQSSSSPTVVALPDISPDILKQLVPTPGEAMNGPPKGAAATLRTLWDTVVQPVVNQLVILEVPENSRIWWCPTSYLCALPLHAAGPCKKGLKNLPDLYISSYTSTLTSLIHARSTISKSQSSPGLLLISQPEGLPKVLEEVEIIKGFGQHMIITSSSGADSYKAAVLEALQSHSWVHFACHGIVEEQPFDSWFQLYHGEHLTVLDIAKAELPNAELAFLSACHAAAGDIHGTPDESIHLAAALQFSGFKSVIGTLWAMVDDDGPDIADAFYRHMFRNGNTVDLRDAAESLNVATRKLRSKGVPPSRWINFIHIGA
jgi:tetratricopeptide (TPR) repeat protein